MARYQRFHQMLSFAAHHWHFAVLQCGAAVCVGWWLRHLPPPGYAIGLLAVLAAAMTVHVEMHSWQKAVWMLLIGGCLFLEFRAIDHDRTEHDKEAKAVRKEESDKFEQIAESIQRSISNSQEQFNTTLARTNRVLNNVTGGKSYAVVLPETFGQDKELPLLIVNRGENVLTGVTVLIAWQGAFAGKVPDFILNAVNNRMNVGTIAPKERQWLNAKLIPDGLVEYEEKGEHVRCAYVYVYAQNFTAQEFLLLRKQEGKWQFKYSIYRSPTEAERETMVRSKGMTIPITKLEEIGWANDPNDIKRLK